MNYEIINLFCHVCCVYSFLPVLFLNPFLWNIMWSSGRTGLGYDSRYDNDSQTSKKLNDQNELFSNDPYMDKSSALRHLQNALFRPIPASGSNFNPQNTHCIRACPVKCEAYFSGVVKIFTLTRGVHAPRPSGQLNSCPNLLSCRFVLGLEPRLNMKFGFNWAGKIERFSKVSLFLKILPHQV
jgi:hypothetical protein